MKAFLICFGIFSISLLISSCSNEANQDANLVQESPKIDEEITPIDEMSVFIFEYMLANIPSPVQSMKDLSNSGINFSKDLLNHPDNHSLYSTNSQKALNFGIYGADLGYIASFRQNQDALNYLAATSKLSEGLGIQQQYGEAVLRIEANIDNQDSIMLIMDKSYADIDNYLRSNERLEAATLIFAGGWIESFYISLHSYSHKSSTEKITEVIWQQKLHLNNLVNVVSEFKEKKDFIELIKALKNTNEIFQTIHTKEEITAETVKQLFDSISPLRNNIVKS